MAKKREGKKKRPKLPEPPSLAKPEPSPTASEERLPTPPSGDSVDSDEDDSTAAPALSSESLASHSSLLSELKDMGFSGGLAKIDPSEIKKPPKRIAAQEIDYQATLRKADPEELEKKGPTFRSRYLKFSEEYERAAQQLEDKNMIPNASIAYACAAMCVYLAEDARMAVGFLSNYAKGASAIAKDPTFQAAKQVLKGVLVKDKTLLLNAANLLSNSILFSREDKDVFEIAIRKAIKEISG
ncbi:MAG: hypothetical protein ACXAEL_01380 [Candidatus Hodarchaeales archaeon]